MLENNREILKKYYKEVYSPLIFVNETKLENSNKAKVYLYDFKEEIELKNFKKVFQGYLPYYVRNYDTIDNYDLRKNIENELIKDSKKIWNNPNILPKRLTQQNGIFGELFNDYYIRNILPEGRMIAYTSKREYNSGNKECKGIDNVVYGIKNEKLEVVLAEAKFYTTLSNSKLQLIEDIEGNILKKKKPHVSKETINDYMSFVLERQAGLYEERVIKINEKVQELNSLIFRENIEFIEAMNRLDNTITFVFFAIFNCNNRTIEHYKSHIEEIIQSFNRQIINTGINNYDIEVVFIPTFNSSMCLKNKMEEWD